MAPEDGRGPFPVYPALGMLMVLVACVALLDIDPAPRTDVAGLLLVAAGALLGYDVLRHRGGR
jgi:hypothetical protein